jgi:hypothetical protein
LAIDVIILCAMAINVLARVCFNHDKNGVMTINVITFIARERGGGDW